MPTQISGSTGVSKVQDGAVTQADLAPNVVGNGPAFAAVAAAATAIGTSYTKVLLGQVGAPPLDRFDTVNSRFQPTTPGVYQLDFAVAFATGSYSIGSAVYKNGSLHKYGSGQVGANSVGSCLVYLNGSTDYVELFAISATAQNTSTNAAGTYFSGFLARAA